jgi:putative RNA 2'-phosphotransferase
MTNQHKRQSKYLSWLLRHGALESGLTMDAAGWAPVPEVLALARMSRATLVERVRTDTKQRLQLDEDRVRASQGHSLSGTPVTQAALEASWAVWGGAGPLWHGTRVEFVESIARTGIVAQARTHVHLAEALDSRVGKRSQVAVMLELDPTAVRAAGQEIYISSNRVVLVRHIPASAIAGYRAMTRRARKQEELLRAALRP